MSKMSRSSIKQKEAKRLLANFFKSINMKSQNFSIKPPVELVKTNDEEIVFVNKAPIFARSNNKLIPTLLSDKLLFQLPKVTVNMGAIPHICNGADVMAPGVVRFEGDFNAEDVVVVLDERHQKPVALTTALYCKEEAEKLKHGKILKNVHYIGDKLWSTIKQLSSKQSS